MATPRSGSRLAIGNRARRLSSIVAVNLLLMLLLLHRTPPVHASASCSAASSAARSSLNHLAPSNDQHRQRRQRFVGPFLARSPLSESAAPLRSSDVELLKKLRGGGGFSVGNKNNSHDSASSISKTSTSQEASDGSRKRTANIVSVSIVACAILFSVFHWDTIRAFFDRERFRKAIIDRLNDIASKGDKGLLTYAFGFTFWEVCGLPTMVVETAAGMAFGFKRGLLGSFVGKTCGSILAFLLGRTLLSDFAGRKMANVGEFGTIQRGVARKPMLSALVVRYSVFPQLFKNFGLSLTRPVTFPMFLLAILIHGFPFSLLWAALGNDSSMRLRASEAGESMAANVVLNGLVVFVGIFGFVVSPAITGLWLADLRKES